MITPLDIIKFIVLFPLYMIMYVGSLLGSIILVAGGLAIFFPLIVLVLLGAALF